MNSSSEIVSKGFAEYHPTQDPDIKIKTWDVTYRDGRIRVMAAKVDAKTKKPLEPGNYMRRFASTQTEATYKRRDMVNMLAAQIMEAQEQRKQNDKQRALRATRLKSESVPCTDTAHNLEDALQALLRSNVCIKKWGAGTQASNITHYRLHFAPLVSQYDLGCTIPYEAIAAYRMSIQQNAFKHGNSHRILSKAERAAHNHLRDDLAIHDRLREIDPQLPAIDYTLDKLGVRIDVEQQKYLPEHVRRNLWARLEALADTEPLMVMMTVLMSDVGPRTAEAAGIYPEDISDYGDYGVVVIGWQEAGGERSPILKTDNGYRALPLSQWAISTIRRCLNKMPPFDYTTNQPLCRTSQLTAWIIALLRDCGLDDVFLSRAQRMMSLFPDHNLDGTVSYDLAAYILRRDAASRMKNYCGFSPSEIDHCLGHEPKETKYKRPEYKTPEQLAPLAKKLSRYAHILPDGTYLNPDADTIRLSDDQSVQIMPRPHRVVLEVDCESATVLTIDGEAEQPGEPIQLKTAHNEILFLPRSVDHGFSGRTGEQIHNRTVIGITPTPNSTMKDKEVSPP